MGNKQPVLANADIDRVLELKPDDPAALLWRARRHLNQHDPTDALTDLDAADHALPPQADLRLELAALYGLANQLPQAIAQYNLWIAAHDKDVRLHEAYNGRCWAQSRLGAAPEQGIKDCDKALRLTPDNAMTLDGRGMLRLRMGDFDRAIGDYTASLKAAPRNPWALYGRGLAEAHKQKTAASEGDIAAATALAPHIAEEFTKRGLTP
jgi:tetratricopeptide (TPR) repeat protein